MTCFLKRALPFVLTLTLGSALGSLFGDGHARRGNFVLMRREHHSCAHRRFQNYDNSSPLVITYKPEAHYTEDARRNQIAGVVRLRMLLGKDGTVSDITPLTELPNGLTDEAIKAASEIKFVPAVIAGQAVDTIQFVEYKFSLD